MAIPVEFLAMSDVPGAVAPGTAQTFIDEIDNEVGAREKLVDQGLHAGVLRLAFRGKQNPIRWISFDQLPGTGGEQGKVGDEAVEEALKSVTHDSELAAALSAVIAAIYINEVCVCKRPVPDPETVALYLAGTFCLPMDMRTHPVRYLDMAKELAKADKDQYEKMFGPVPTWANEKAKYLTMAAARDRIHASWGMNPDKARGILGSLLLHIFAVFAGKRSVTKKSVDFLTNQGCNLTFTEYSRLIDQLQGLRTMSLDSAVNWYHWLRDTVYKGPQFAPVRTALERMATAGRSTLTIIIGVINKYPTFDWGVVKGDLSVEWDAAIKAADAMKGKEFVPMDSTIIKNHAAIKYRKLSNVCGQIDYELSGCTTAQNLKGSSSVPLTQGIRKAIDDYRKGSGNSVPVTPTELSTIKAYY